MARSHSQFGAVQVAIAQRYLRRVMPAMEQARYTVHALDGPPGGPRFAVTAELCDVSSCPRGITPEQAAGGRCLQRACPLRHTARLLLNGNGDVVLVTSSDLHWTSDR
jgi:hypothetical protein